MLVSYIFNGDSKVSINNNTKKIKRETFDYITMCRERERVSTN